MGKVKIKCQGCGAEALESFTTSTTELENNTLVIIRNVPCYKCTECNEIMYTASTIAKLERILETAKHIANEISIIDFQKRWRKLRMNLLRYFVFSITASYLVVRKYFYYFFISAVIITVFKLIICDYSFCSI